MILLDTHIWIWLADESDRLSARHHDIIEARRNRGLGISVISCWEVAKLVERGRLEFTSSVEHWMSEALRLPDIQLINLTPRIAIESTMLPGEFHQDPADQIIVATARVHDMELLTNDGKIRKYEHVRVI